MLRLIRCVHPPSIGAPGGVPPVDHGEGGGRARLRPVTSKRSDLRPPGRPPELRGKSRVPQARLRYPIFLYIRRGLKPGCRCAGNTHMFHKAGAWFHRNGRKVRRQFRWKHAQTSIACLTSRRGLQDSDVQRVARDLMKCFLSEISFATNVVYLGRPAGHHGECNP